MRIRRLVDRTTRRTLVPALAAALVLVAAPAALAASGDLSWSYTADSPPHWNDVASAVAPGPDGTVYVAGMWASFIPETETGDITLMRLRPTEGSSGPVIWRRTWDDPVRHLGDQARSLITDPAGNAIVVGATSTDADLVVIKWRPNGTRAWVARYASRYGMEDLSSAVACDGKGNVYVAGFRYLLGNQDADWLMVKFRASDGKRLWVRVWSGTEKPASDDRPMALAVDAAGYSYSAGYSDDAAGVHDAIIMKRTPAGKLAWTRRTDGAAHGEDAAESIVLTGDKLYVAGVTTAIDATRDLLALKYRSNGKRLWRLQWSPPSVDLAHVNDLAVDRNGNGVAACRAYSATGDLALMASWTASGESRWADLYTLSGLSAQATAVAVSRAGTAWFAGRVGTRGLLLKYDATGSPVWSRHFSPDGTSRNTFLDLCTWGSDSLAVVGASTTDQTRTDFVAAKYVR